MTKGLELTENCPSNAKNSPAKSTVAPISAEITTEPLFRMVIVIPGGASPDSGWKEYESVSLSWSEKWSFRLITIISSSEINISSSKSFIRIGRLFFCPLISITVSSSEGFRYPAPRKAALTVWFPTVEFDKLK